MTLPAPAWLDELSFMVEPATARGPADDTGRRWLSMGLARLGPGAGLLADDDRDEELIERQRLLRDHHDAVFVARTGTTMANAEVLAVVESWWRARFATQPPTDVTVDPLEAAGRLVQEDLCVLLPIDGSYRLAAACLCFPSHWRLHEKVGRTVGALHAPVPRYEHELAGRVDRFLERLRPGAGARRRNWTVHDRPDRFAPWPPAPAERRPLAGVDDVGEGRWLRSELQTLRRLPRTGAVLFTIKTQRVPFAVLAARPDAAARLATRLRTQPPDLTAANGIGPDLTTVLAWLDRIAS